MNDKDALERKISLRQALSVLTDADCPVDSLALCSLSDLEEEDLQEFHSHWLNISLLRRLDIMLGLEKIADERPFLIFDHIARDVLAMDPSGEVRSVAIANLGEDCSLDLIELLIQVMHNDSVFACRAAAAAGLGKYVYLYETDDLPPEQGRMVVSALLQVMRADPEKLVRCNALESLGFSSSVDVITLIEEASQDRDVQILSSALRAMGRSYDVDRWGISVLESFAHSSQQVRRAAIHASGELRLLDAVDQLVDLIYDPDRDIQAAAIQALGEIGGQRAHTALIELQVISEDEQVIQKLVEDAQGNVEIMESILSTGFTYSGSSTARTEYVKDEDSRH